jgi:hypothetical protein
MWVRCFDECTIITDLFDLFDGHLEGSASNW